MSSLIDIARSGVMAYRTAMQVTTENVANVGTEGYVRRDVTMSAMAGAAMTPTSASTLGQGVQVTDVRRAFDGLTADRLRASESAVAAAATRVAAGHGLEQAFLPGADGIDSAMAEFFGGLNSLASYPGDVGLRRVVMEMGSGVAVSFTEAASTINALQEDALASVRLATEKVSGLLTNLGSLNDLMKANSSTAGAANPVQDQRDAALTELAKKIEINVSLDEVGRAEVRLGPGPGGLVLLDKAGAAHVQVGGTSPLSLAVSKSGETQKSTVLTGGEIGGQVTALGAIASAKAELDQLARRFSDAVNTAHASGIDLDGLSGGPLFALEGTKVIPGVTNTGGTQVTLSGPPPAQDLYLTFDHATGNWTASTAQGSALATGKGTLSVGASMITLEGPVHPGDSFVLKRTEGQALDMRFVLSSPRAIAAAAATIVAPGPENQGTASATIRPTSAVVDGLQPLDQLLSPNPAQAVSMIQPGVVGVIPAGASSANLVSFGRQSSADLPVTDGMLGTGGQLSVSVAGVQHIFTVPPGATSTSFAAALNDGTITTASGDRLSDLGMASAGADGVLTLSLAKGNIGSATLTLAGGSVSGQVLPELPTASSIQVFTRDGRQVAGDPLSTAQAAALLTEANGFSPTAAYDTSTLNGAGGEGYRGMKIDRQIASGLHSVSLTPTGGMAGSMLLQSGESLVNVAIPENASARRIAQTIQNAIPGMAATAETAVLLSDIADGTIQLDLAGTNVNPVRLTATVTNGDYGALARAINASAASTGVKAELSAAGDRILLRHSTGEDIRISGFQHNLGATLIVTPADEVGLARSAGVTLGAGVSATKVSGQVTATAASPFSINGDLGTFASATDVFSGNMVSREVFATGEGQRLTFMADGSSDAAAVSPDGLSASAAGLDHQLTLNGVSVTVSGAATGADVAQGLLDELRSVSPLSFVSGAPVSTLPPEGAAVNLSLDGQDFVLRMENGVPVVDGPEAGRITASFDASNRLQLTVTGGVPDGIGLKPDFASPMATAFGLTAASVFRIEGQPINASTLPPVGQTVSAKIDGTVYDIQVSAGPSLSTPPGFPGTAQINGAGALVIEVSAALGPVQIMGAAEEAGFAVSGVQARVVDGALELNSVTGTPIESDLVVSATAAERLSLENLPPEDLIVVFGNGGALRLAGEIGPVSSAPKGRPTELVVTDAASGAVELLDKETGHSIAAGWLDDEGRVSLGGNLISLSGRLETGDRFFISPNRVPEGDARTLQNIIGLAEADPSEGGGFSRILAELTTGIGAQLDAAKGREAALASGHETLTRKMAEIGAVDLDAEAARLIELQQAYQASAQALSIARQLFDTILNIM